MMDSLRRGERLFVYELAFERNMLDWSETQISRMTDTCEKIIENLNQDKSNHVISESTLIDNDK
jgi:hypothetical protein